MQRLLHTGIAALALLAASASAQTVRTVVQNGPSEDLYDMVILGDGYTAAEQGQFDQDVVDVIDYFRNTPNKFPYGAYFDLYNVHTVFRASNQSGADKPPLNIFVDTAYDASYWTGGTERCLYIGNGGQAMADAALAPDTDLYVVVANWPSKRRLHWSTLLRARAIENQAYVVGVNRVGSGGGLDYSGDSAIIDPLGEILATGAGAETVLSAAVDPAHVASTREHFRFLQDRR